MICFPKGPLVLRYAFDVNAIFQSFFQKFLTVSYRIGFLIYRYIFSISVVFS